MHSTPSPVSISTFSPRAPTPLATPQVFSLPSLGPSVDASRHVAAGTSTQVVLGWLLAPLVALMVTLATSGIALVGAIIGFAFQWYFDRRGRALIHGQGVRVSVRQFPQLNEALVNFSRRLGLEEVPDAYVVQDSVLNAFAVRFGRKQCILLTDELVAGCMANHGADALAFVLAHELAHVALGHNGRFRGALRGANKKLSRLDEYSCDAVAHALLDDTEAALRGVVLLTAGPDLLPMVDVPALVAQANEVAADAYSKRAEKALTYPLNLHRVHRLSGLSHTIAQA